MSRVSPPLLSRTSCRFRVLVLGPLALYRDGVAIDTGRWQRRVGSLFKLLVTTPERRRLREEIVDLLWPEALPQAGAANLRLVLHLLRRELGGGEPSPVLLERTWIGLNPAYAWEVDLDRFVELTRGIDVDGESLMAAAQLYRGEPLVEDRYEDWAMPAREQIQLKWRQVCLRLAGIHRARGAQEEAVGWLERVLEVDPLDEEAMQELLGALRERGRPTEALRRYREFARRLREELEVAPMPETLAAVQGLKVEETPLPPPVRQEAGEGEPRVVAVAPRYPLSTRVPLVGRATELRQVERSLSECKAGRSGLLLIAAEAGMGKTRLLAEVTRQALAAGMLVLAGGCYEHEKRLPYGPLHDALLDYVQAQRRELLQRQLEGELVGLVQIVPELARRIDVLPEVWAGEAESQRLRLFLAVAHAVERIARDRPLVLLLDDAQWADDASLQLPHFLLRQPGLGRVLVVCAFRQEEVDGEVLQAHLTSSVEVRAMLQLQPLGETELGALLEERLGDRCAATLVEALSERSGGNPFFALQMLRLLQQEGQLEQTGGGWQLAPGRSIQLPEAVRETVVRRLGLLQPEEQEVLTLGAILGREFPFAAQEMLWQGEERDLFAGLDGATAAYFLSEMDGRYGFRHPLLHEVIYEHTPAQRRLRLHGRAGTVLEKLFADQAGDHAARLAYHFMQGEQPERALPYAMQAGDQAEKVFAHSEAEGHYRAAEALAVELADGARQAEACEKLGAVLTTIGRYDEALSVLERAVSVHQARGDLEGLGGVTAQIGRIHFPRGTPEEGIQRLQSAVESLQGKFLSPALAALETALTRLFFASGKYEEGAETAQRASDLARGIGDDRLLAEVEVWRGAALALLGHQDDAVRALEGAIRLAEAVGDRDTLNQALNNVGCVYMLRGELVESVARFERSLEFFERLGSPGDIEFVAANLGEALFYLGDWRQSRGRLEDAINVVRSAGPTWHAAYPLFALGQLGVAEGDWDEASRHLEECISIAQRSHDLQALRFGQRALAEKDVLEGHPQAACARLDAVLDRPGLEEQDVTPLLPLLAWAYLEMGERDRGEDVARLAIRRASAQNNRLALVTALWVCGVVLSRQSRWEEAEHALEEAVSLPRTMPYPYAEARALYEYGLMYVRKGELRQAGERLEEALTIFRRLGAQPYIQRTELALAELTPA